MIAQSQSGTGKTAAFALTILSRINYDLHAPQVITVAPLIRSESVIMAWILVLTGAPIYLLLILYLS
jgi:ATP-dependent RNA helicase DDX19/DBP5